VADHALALELMAAYTGGQQPPHRSAKDPSFSLSAAYAVEGELVRLRRASGRSTVGLKVGFAGHQATSFVAHLVKAAHAPVSTMNPLLKIRTRKIPRPIKYTG
jgi:2-keto-4-pentenoate hydratase